VEVHIQQVLERAVENHNSPSGLRGISELVASVSDKWRSLGR
jgi:hypothetical protein